MLKTNKKGFTLIESIIAITIIVLAAAAILPLVLYSSQTTYSNQNLITANNLASSVMEEIRSLDFESIGTVGGNPEGLIEQNQTRRLNGYDYNIKTTISWTSAEHDEGVNPLAYKNISIIVKGKNVHSNAEGITLAELHSIATRDGEEPLIEEGHLKVRILDTEYSPVYRDISVRIDRAGRPTQTQNIDYSGQALFGMLDQGNYRVTVHLPDDMFGIGGDVYDPESNTIVKGNVYVANYATNEIIFFVDYKDNAGGLELQFIDKAKNRPIVRKGAISIELNFGGTNFSINKRFEIQDFIDSTLPKEVLGFLPVNAEITNINVYGITGYKNYRMTEGETLLKNDGNAWNYRIQEKDIIETVVIPLVSGYFYEESTREDFEHYHDMSDTLYVNNDDYLSLMEYKPNILREEIESLIAKSKNENNKTVEEAFDNSLKGNDEWMIDLKDDSTLELIIAFEKTKVLSGFKVYSKQNNGPKGYKVEISNDGIDYTEVNSGEFVNFNNDKYLDTDGQTVTFGSPVSCKYLKITFNTWHTNGNSAVIKEIKLLSIEGFAHNGYRIVGPLDLSIYESVPQFKIHWEVFTPLGTSFEVRALMLNEGEVPEISDFTENALSSGDIIPNIGYHELLEGKRLWLLEQFTSNEENKASPILKYLYIDAGISD